MSLVVVAVGILLATAILALALSSAPRLASALGAAGAVVACAVGMRPAIAALTRGPLTDLTHGWAVPSGALDAGLDPLSAFFLIPLLVLSALTAVYGREYLLAYAKRKSLGPPAFFF